MTDKNNPGIKSEKRVSSLLGAEVTLGSGAIDSYKGDFELDIAAMKFLGECKATEAQSLSIKREWLLKIAKEALEVNRTPLFTASFVHGNGTAKKEGDWVAMPLRVFKEIMLELEEYKEKSSPEDYDWLDR